VWRKRSDLIHDDPAYRTCHQIWPKRRSEGITRSMHLQCMMHPKPNLLTRSSAQCSAFTYRNSPTGPSRLPKKQPPIGQRAVTASEDYSCTQCPSTNTATHHWPRLEAPMQRDTQLCGRTLTWWPMKWSPERLWHPCPSTLPSTTRLLSGL
jgi:hypothetical protein